MTEAELRDWFFLSRLGGMDEETRAFAEKANELAERIGLPLIRHLVEEERANKAAGVVRSEEQVLIVMNALSNVFANYIAITVEPKGFPVLLDRFEKLSKVAAEGAFLCFQDRLKDRAMQQMAAREGRLDA